MLNHLLVHLCMFVASAQQAGLLRPLLACMQDMALPHNMSATTSTAAAIAGAHYAVHALPVQHSRVFLQSIKVT